MTTESQHLAVTYDRQTVKTYVDRAPKISLVGTWFGGTDFSNVVLGQDRRGNQYFSRSIDDVVIFDRPLSPNELRSSGGRRNGSAVDPVQSSDR